MQENPRYDDVVGEIGAFLRERVAAAVEAGIAPERLILDPGIGFGKTVAHNLEILRRLDELKALGRPILIGPSRKSFIGQLSGAPVGERLPGTIAAVVLGIARGADIVRVHDVRAVKQAVILADAIIRGERR
jgi:dihydropteroate synthase